MAYLVCSPADAIRSIAQLTGPVDAQPGYAAFTGDGDIYVMTNIGWQKVYDHVTGTNFTPDIPLPGNQAIVSNGDTFDVGSGTVTMVVADGVASATYDAA